MTKILDQAIAMARALSAGDQDALGAVLLSLAEEWPIRADDLDEETRAAIREGIAQAKRGEFVPDEDIQALWKTLRPMRVRYTPMARRQRERVGRIGVR
jgi:predicted transcriptional regulator